MKSLDANLSATPKSNSDTINDKYPENNFFNHYFNYLDYPNNTEASLTIHRWCAISLIGAWLGRQFTLPFGFFNFIPNQYIQIVGEPATKKSTAIKIATKLLIKAGYTTFAPEKTSMQQFLIDLNNLTWGADDSEESEDIQLEKNIFGSSNPRETAESLPVAETFIASDEFIDFIGINNIDFISLLGTLWDYDAVYSLRLKHSKAVYINRPTINIISGNTHEGFHQAFPPDMQGKGFFSRLLLIHSEPTHRKIHRPHPPCKEKEQLLINYLFKIKETCIGEAIITDEADELCAYIYEHWKPMTDARFKKYAGRRYTHLLKLAMICAAARISKIIEKKDILMANTLLTYAEYSMPKAMGQFGKGRNSAATHKILDIISSAQDPVSMKTIIKELHHEVDNLSILNDLINSLRVADKIQVTSDGHFLPKREQRIIKDTVMIKPTWLHHDEIMGF